MSTLVMSAFVAEVAVITYREFRTPSPAPIGIPLPSRYLAPIAVYGTLALFSGQAEPLAGLVAWGLVVATLLNLWATPASRQADAGSKGVVV